MTGFGAEGAHGEEPEPVIRDNDGSIRDGQVRDRSRPVRAGPFPGAGGIGTGSRRPERRVPTVEGRSQCRSELDLARQEAAERTADLQRVTAEYANYRKRVDRDRESVIAAAKASVIMELLTVLDDLDRARAHGDLVGSFGTVADKLTGALSKLGLEPLGAVGDPFDPAVHEAVQFGTSTEVTEPTVTCGVPQRLHPGRPAGAPGGGRRHRTGARDVAEPAAEPSWRRRPTDLRRRARVPIRDRPAIEQAVPDDP